MKKTRKGIVLPVRIFYIISILSAQTQPEHTHDAQVHVPIAECHISIESDGDIVVTPRYGKLASTTNIEKKVKVYMSQRPSYDVLRINSPLARLLHSYRRLSELSTCYVSLCICAFACGICF